MGITRKQQEWIDAYLREKLGEDDLQEFETALAGDELFKKEFLFQQSLAKAARLDAVREAMEQARINNLLKNKKVHPKFEIVQNTIKAAKTKNKNRKQWQTIKICLLRGAIAACILLTGSWIGWTNHLKKDVEKELLAVFDKTDLIGSDINQENKKNKKSGLRSINPVTDTADRAAIIKDKLDKIKIALSEKHADEVLRLINNLQMQFDYQSEELENYKEEIIEYKLDEIDELYREERFDEALSLLQDLQKQLPSGTAQPALKYYEANLYAQITNYTQSIKMLRRLIRQESNIQDDARWLLGLLYLKTNEKTKAKKQFEILAEESEQYKDKARQKLKKHYLL